MTDARGDAAVEHDPLDGDDRLPEYFGESWQALDGFRTLLEREGVLRGLIGPREVGRLWARHLLNSAAAVQFLPDDGRIIDLGSGAGLPGIVVAAMRPRAEVVLLEPMERRTTWLTEVAAELSLANVTVLRGRAQDVQGDVAADVVTSRAVASMDKLYRWSGPLLRVGGELVALKGERAQEEVDAAVKVGARSGFSPASVTLAASLAGVEPTRVVRATRDGVARVR